MRWSKLSLHLTWNFGSSCVFIPPSD